MIYGVCMLGYCRWFPEAAFNPALQSLFSSLLCGPLGKKTSRELNRRSPSPHKATTSSLKLQKHTQKHRRPRSIFSGAESCSVRVGRRANKSHVKDRWRRRQLCARVCASVCLCVFIPMTTKMKTCTSLHREPNKEGGGGCCHWAEACSTISLMS